MELLTAALLVFCVILWSQLGALKRRLDRLEGQLPPLPASGPGVEPPELRPPGASISAAQGAEDDGRSQKPDEFPVGQPSVNQPPVGQNPPSTWPGRSFARPNVAAAGEQGAGQTPPLSVFAPAAPLLPAPVAPPRQPLPSRTIFALLGAVVTLGGAAWFTAALARSGVLTREIQLGLAALLAVLLYGLAGRPAPIIGEAMRGLGYGILILCVGALAGAGVVPPAVVLLGILLLSLAVGLHGVRQGRLLGTATALAGASISTWILADNLPSPALAQLALLGILACTVLAERRLAEQRLSERGLVQPASALLSLFPAAGILGLVVTSSAHGQPGHPLMWALLLLTAVGSALLIGLRGRSLQASERDQPEPSSVPSRPVPLRPVPLRPVPSRPVLAAAGILLAGGIGALPLLKPFQNSGGLNLLNLGLSTAALLLVGTVTAGLATWIHLRTRGADSAGTTSGESVSGKTVSGLSSDHRLLRDALLGVGVGTLGAALSQSMDGVRVSSRLLGLASATALMGHWMKSRVWRGIGAAGLLLVLLDHLFSPWPSSVVIATLALGTAVALAGRTGAVVAGLAGATLALAVTTLLPGTALPLLNLHFLLAVLVVLALWGGVRVLGRTGSRSNLARAQTVSYAAVGAALMLLPIPFLFSGSPLQSAIQGLIAGALLYLAPGARLASRLVWSASPEVSSPELSSPEADNPGTDGTGPEPVSASSLVILMELLGVVAAVLGVGRWTIDLIPGVLCSALPLTLLAVLVAWLPGESRWTWRAWPVLGLALLVTVVSLTLVPQSAGVGVFTLLSAALLLGALWLLLTPAGLRLLRPRSVQTVPVPPVRRALDSAPVQEGVLPALLLGLLALMGRTFELLNRGASTDWLTTTTASSAVLLGSAIVVLIVARRRNSPLRWWVALAAFGLASLKLVFVDFGDLGGIARGGATALIGLLLLGIGQLAPRPEPPVQNQPV